VITSKKGGASAASDILLPGKAGGTVAVRRTLASTICCIADPTQVPRPRQLRDASTVMRFQPAHQSMINRRFNDRASCPARKSPKPALARKPPIHLPASGKGGHESALALACMSATSWSMATTQQRASRARPRALRKALAADYARPQPAHFHDEAEVVYSSAELVCRSGPVH